MSDKRNKQKITNVSSYVGKYQRVNVLFNKTVDLNLLKFFIERNQILPEFAKPFYNHKNHLNRTASAHEDEFITLTRMLHCFLVHSSNLVNEILSPGQASM